MSTARLDAPLRGHFSSRDGLQLYHEIWASPAKARATLLFVHGYGDHCGRYAWPIDHFAPKGFDCVAFDYRGHGQAAGQRGHCYHFEEFLGDVDAAVELALRRRPEHPLFVVGHSHGGLVAMRYALDARPKPAQLKGFVLTSPFFGMQLSAPVKTAAARLLSQIAPRLGMPSGLPAEALSHETSVVEAYKTDRWVHKVATSRWFTEAMGAQRFCFDHASDLRHPILVLQAGSDQLVAPDATQALFDALPKGEKELVVYPGYYHEIMNEVGRDRVYADIDTWLAKRL